MHLLLAASAGAAGSDAWSVAGRVGVEGGERCRHAITGRLSGAAGTSARWLEGREGSCGGESGE